MEELGELFTELEQSGLAEFAAEGLEGTAHRTVDVRYRGQGYELNVRLERAVAARRFRWLSHLAPATLRIL